MQALRDVVLLVGFGLALSAILGIQLFQGLLKHRCFEPGADAPLDADAGVCAVEPPGRACPAGLECRAWDANPLAGTVGKCSEMRRNTISPQSLVVTRYATSPQDI